MYFLNIGLQFRKYSLQNGLLRLGKRSQGFFFFFFGYIPLEHASV